MSSIAAAQREARRRKITQNAQARMNKLLGRPSEMAATEQVPNSVTLPSVQSSQPKEGNHPPSLTQSSPYNLRRRNQKLDSPSLSSGTDKALISPSISDSKPSPKVTSASIVNTPMQASETGDMEHIPVSENAPTEDVQPQTGESTNYGRPTTNNFDAKSLELFRVVACITTAFLSRYILTFGFGLFMVDSIFLPFFTMEAFITYLIETYCKDLSTWASRGTLMSAALMLCGIKPELMGVYNNIMGYVTMLASDFGIYFFSFLIWHSLLT
ncbi:calcium signal-modulating cyclophilin ligand [Plakobranchus ocellatus]|uniref:Calcium signal-modulating cyclophilin ligand n=1 Tax=Plakobranchus ocellatus TaxID=259542 RepID=A0AAV4CB85_9GAST|nr:calcium signal-modulating cyclophilin ligand [Plakobranchus ocellatus]